MQKLTLKAFLLLFLPFAAIGQDDVDNLLNDATFYAGKFVAPATEAVVYQAASAWSFSPKKRDAWKITIALQDNLFIVPKSNREMQISNSDFSFFQIEGVSDNSPVTVPTALGDKSNIYLYGTIDFLGNPQDLRLRVDGINQETVNYPYLQGAMALPYGFEILAKYSFKNKLKKGDYQIYGFALQYNISQHFEKMKNNNWHLATLFAYNNENLSVDYIQNAGTTFQLGIERMQSKINTLQMQVNLSKEYKKLELQGGMVFNHSNIKYYFDGVDTGLNLKEILNEKAKSIYKKQSIVFGEISGRYNFYNAFHLQTTLSFGKHINTNFGIQYEFN